MGQGARAGLGDVELEDLEFQRHVAELEEERQELRDEIRRAKRNTDTPTPEMQRDVECLLEAFGIPFVHAPAEAEAQCAFLDSARLVDATASDDSDALVFGTREVYRRLFADEHLVECYSAERLETKLGLKQDHLVVLAMLLGCDYSLGLHGVGIVNGLEIIRAMAPGVRSTEYDAVPDDAGQWLAQMQQLRSWSENVAGWADDNAGVEPTDSRAMAEFKRSHRNFRTQWSFSQDFPSRGVFDAFTTAQVDRSMEPFAWALVDDERVVGFLQGLANQSEERTRERLDPALKRYRDTLRQPRITEYMVPTGVGDVAVVRSSRMREALRGLRGEEPQEQQSPSPPHGRAAKRPPEGRPPRRAAKRSALQRPAAPWTLKPNAGQILLDSDDEVG